MSGTSIVATYQSYVENLGKSFKKRREASGFSRREIGDLIGLSEGALEAFEKGKTTPRSGPIREIAQLSDEWEQGRVGRLGLKLIRQRALAAAKASFNENAGYPTLASMSN